MLLLVIQGIKSYAAVNEDSIRRAIRKAPNDTVKVKIYYKWDEKIYLQDYKLDIRLNEKVVELCLKNLERNDLTKREKKFYESHLASSYNNIGLAMSNQGLYAAALTYYQKSVKLAARNKDTTAISYAYNNIGVVYWNKKDFSKAEKYLKACIHFSDVLGDELGKADIYNNLGLVYKDSGDTLLAMQCFEKSLAISKGDTTNLVTANALINMAIILSWKNNFTLAAQYYKRAGRIFTNLNYYQGLADAYLQMGNMYYRMKQYARSAESCAKGLEAGRKYNYNLVIRDGCFCVYKAKKAEGKIAEALNYFEEYNWMADSMSADSRNRELEKVEMQNEFESKAEASRLKIAGERKAAAERTKHERTQRYALIGGLILVLAFAAFMFQRFKITQRQKKIIEQQQKETALAKELVEEKNKEIIDSINYAKRLQEAILPSTALLDKYFTEHFILYLPKDIVAGDFYWLETKGDLVFFAVADCTGHGVPGAMVSVVCSTALNHAIGEFNLSDPGKILDKVRQLVLETFESKGTDVKDGMDISLCVLSLSTRSLAWAGANNPLWHQKAGEEEIHEIRADKQPVGRFAKETPFTTHTLQLQQGDALYMYTDGYPDQFGGDKGKKLKALNMKKLFTSIRHKNMKEQGAYIAQAFEKWKGNLEQIDDVCVGGVRIK